MFKSLRHSIKIHFYRGLLYYYYMEINKIKIDKKKEV